MSSPGRKYRNLFQDISRIDLGTYEQLSGVTQKNGLFLGELATPDMWRLMRQCGLISHLRQKGFTDLSITVFTDESEIDHLGVFDADAELLIDLRLSKKRYVWNFDSHQRAYDMIVIEWLSTRNPRKKTFSPDRPQLPGQQYPGLGCLKQLLKMMVYFSRRMACDGFLDMPDHLHLSIMYSQSFYFLDPEKEGTLRALLASLKNESLYTIAWASVTHAILHSKNSEPYEYAPAEQLYPVSKRLHRYFTSPIYRERVDRSRYAQHFIIDHDAMEARRAELLAAHDASEL